MLLEVSYHISTLFFTIWQTSFNLSDSPKHFSRIERSQIKSMISTPAVTEKPTPDLCLQSCRITKFSQFWQIATVASDSTFSNCSDLHDVHKYLSLNVFKWTFEMWPMICFFEVTRSSLFTSIAFSNGLIELNSVVLSIRSLLNCDIRNFVNEYDWFSSAEVIRSP